MLADGRFLAAGRTPAGQAAVARFTAAGELDTTWAADQPVPGLLVVAAQSGRHARRAHRPAPTARSCWAAPRWRSTSRRRCSSPGSPPTVISTRRSAPPASSSRPPAPRRSWAASPSPPTGTSSLAATSSGSETDRGLLVRLTAAGVRDATLRHGRRGRASASAAPARRSSTSRSTARGASTSRAAGATTPRHQLFVARLTTAGALDPPTAPAAPATRSPTSTARRRRLRGRRPAAARRRRRHRARRRHRQERDRPRLAPGRPRPLHPGGRPGRGVRDRRHAHAGHLALARLRRGRARLAPGRRVRRRRRRRASAPPRSSGSPATTRTAAPTPRSTPPTPPPPTRPTCRSAPAASDRIFALALTPQGRLIAAGESQDAERERPLGDRPPRRRRTLPAGRRRGDAGSRPCPAARSGPARPSASTRPASTDPDGPIVQVRVGHRRRRDLRAHRREGARQLPRPDRRRRAPARHRRRRADARSPARR